MQNGDNDIEQDHDRDDDSKNQGHARRLEQIQRGRDAEQAENGQQPGVPALFLDGVIAQVQDQRHQPTDNQGNQDDNCHSICYGVTHNFFEHGIVFPYLVGNSIRLHCTKCLNRRENFSFRRGTSLHLRSAKLIFETTPVFGKCHLKPVPFYQNRQMLSRICIPRFWKISDSSCKLYKRVGLECISSGFVNTSPYLNSRPP